MSVRTLSHIFLRAPKRLTDTGKNAKMPHSTLVKVPYM